MLLGQLLLELGNINKGFLHYRAEKSSVRKARQKTLAGVTNRTQYTCIPAAMPHFGHKCLWHMYVLLLKMHAVMIA